MRITLIRHGAAGEAARDEDRALTRKGRRAVRLVAQTLAKRGDRFDFVLSSPLVRAVQTAEIVAETLGHDEEVLIDASLRPEASPHALVEKIAQASPDANVALVAHEPILSSAVGVLLGRAFPRGLRKGEAVRLRSPDGRAGSAELRWCVDPETGELEKL